MIKFEHPAQSKSNPRFGAPVELVLGILGAIAFGSTWYRTGSMGRATIAAPFLLHCVVGLAQLAGMSLPTALTGFELSGIYAPKDLSGTSRVVNKLQSLSSTTSSIWTIGSADIMNPPLVEVMLREKAVRKSVRSLYSWDEQDLTIQRLIDRVPLGGIVVCDTGRPTSSILMTRWDSDLIAAISSGAQFDAVGAIDSGFEKGRFLLFQRRVVAE